MDQAHSLGHTAHPEPGEERENAARSDMGGVCGDDEAGGVAYGGMGGEGLDWGDEGGGVEEVVWGGEGGGVL